MQGINAVLVQVFVAIMADKMKEQQRRQQEEARKEATRKQATEVKENPALEKRTTRSAAKRDEAKDNEGTTAEKKDQNEKEKGKKSTGKGKAKKVSQMNTISNYFKKAEVEVPENNPTVQEALEKAAEELEANPTAIGEQDLVATQQPALVTGGKMRRYQLEGLEWLKSLWMNGLCGILADEMGLGKTVQAISLIAFFKEKNISGPFLIAAPLSTVSNWVDEFARWTPSIQTVLYHGTKDERAEIRKRRMKLQDQKKMDFPVVCTSYEICMNDRKFLAQYQWRYIIVVCWRQYFVNMDKAANELTGRGSPLEKHELSTDQGATHVQLSKSTSHHGYSAAKQYFGVVVPFALFASRSIQ